MGIRWRNYLSNFGRLFRNYCLLDSINFPIIMQPYLIEA
jgi:hypothetical protein